MYELLADTPREYQKLLFKASSSLESRKLHWFLDDELFATCEAGTRLFCPPQLGRHTLMCVDEYGHSSSVTFEVR